MTRKVFAALFGLNFLLFSCNGQISLPPGGDSFVVLPGENVMLAWKLDVSLSTVLGRSWTFLPNNESFADIGGNAGVVEKPEYAPGPFTIKKPATLILENVTIQYSGIYRFTIFASNKLSKSDVTVTVAGQISLPPGGDNFVVLPGENVTLTWKLDVSLSTVLARSWTFLSNNESFADIGGNAGVVEKPKYAPGPFTIKKPATLILENVTIQYSGIYRFTIFASNKLSKSDVTVTVAVKPNVTVNCTNPLTINEGSNFTCLCKAKGGKPPADITWEKDGVPEPGGLGKEQKLLSRVNVSEVDIGTYTCVGKSYTLTKNKSIEVEVKPNAKPGNTNIMLTPKTVKIGEKVVITCESNGVPEPKYNITLNGTEVSTEKTYIIPMVNKTHTGRYKCFVWNKLGNDSDSDILTVVAQQGPTTAAPISKTSKKTTTAKRGNGTAANKEDDGTVVVWHIVVSLLSGIIIGFLLSHIVSCSRRRWFKNRKRQSNPEAQTTEVDTTYQELDLSRMNAEDNYQSLGVNAVNNDAVNDDDSTYTELNKARDVENNYQSLTY